MGRSGLLAAGILVSVLLLGGCASPLEKFLSMEDSRSPTKALGRCLTNELNANEFLDCVFDVKVDSENKELLLLRGHAVVGLLAIYGKFSLDNDPVNKEDDSRRLLGRIYAAETSLWKASICKVNSESAPSTTKFSDIKCERKAPTEHVLMRDVEHLNRVGKIIQVALAAGKPAARRAANFFEKLIAIIVTPTPSGALAMARDFRKALVRAATIEAYGSAYFGAVKKWMQEIQDREKGDKDVPNLDDWEKIDTLYLKPACDEIKRMGKDERLCFPKRRPTT